jgi:hypothetical protein
LLCWQCRHGLGPGCHVLDQTATDISRRYKTLGGKPPEVQMKKCLFRIFLASLGEKRLWRHHQAGAQRLVGDVNDQAMVRDILPR